MHAYNSPFVYFKYKNAAAINSLTIFIVLSYLVKPDFISVDIRRNNTKLLKKDIPVLAWTIKNQNDYDSNIDKYTNLIIDDYDNIKRK